MLIKKNYVQSSRLLARESIQTKVKRIVVTGAATSVIGVDKIQPSYNDASKWASSKFEGRPNEYAKYASEKVCWDEVLGAET